MQVKQSYEDVKKRKEKEEKALEPLQREIKKLTTQQDKYRRDQNMLEVERNKAIEKMKKDLRDATEKAESEISRYNAEFSQAEKHERDRKQRLQVQKEKLAAVERELEDFRLNRDHDNNGNGLWPQQFNSNTKNSGPIQSLLEYHNSLAAADNGSRPFTV